MPRDGALGPISGSFATGELRERRAAGLAHGDGHRADTFFEHEVARRAGVRARPAEGMQCDRRANGRMTRERNLASGREDAHTLRVRRICRRIAERRLRKLNSRAIASSASSGIPLASGKTAS